MRGLTTWTQWENIKWKIWVLCCYTSWPRVTTVYNSYTSDQEKNDACANISAYRCLWVLLRSNSRAPQFTHLKCTVQNTLTERRLPSQDVSIAAHPENPYPWRSPCALPPHSPPQTLISIPSLWMCPIRTVPVNGHTHYEAFCVWRLPRGAFSGSIPLMAHTCAASASCCWKILQVMYVWNISIWDGYEESRNKHPMPQAF